MHERALSGEPAPGGLCRICGAELPADSLRCARCRAVHGEGFRCPHCRAVADVTRKAGELRCQACGGPRLLVEQGRATLSGKEHDALRLARALGLRSGLWKAFTLLSSGAGLMLLGVALLAIVLASPGVLLGSLGVAVALLPLVAAFGAYRRSSSYGRERARAVHAAELSATRDLAERAGGELTAASLGRALELDETRAELLLSELSLDDLVQRRVTDSGELAYSARPRVRVGETESSEQEEPEQARATTERSSP